MQHRPGTLSFGTEKAKDSWTGPQSRPGGFANLRLPGLDSTQVTIHPGRANLLITGDLTVSFWIKVLTLPAAGVHHCVISHGVPGSLQAQNYVYLFGYTNNAGVYRWRSMHEYNAGASVALTSTNGYTLTVWHHVLFSRSASDTRLRFVVDGVQDSNQLISNMPNGGTSGTPQIGSTLVDGQHANCLLDDLRIYDRALTVDEAIVLYNRSRRPFSLGSGAGLTLPDVAPPRPGEGGGGSTDDERANKLRFLY